MLDHATYEKYESACREKCARNPGKIISKVTLNTDTAVAMDRVSRGWWRDSRHMRIVLDDSKPYADFVLECSECSLPQYHDRGE